MLPTQPGRQMTNQAKEPRTRILLSIMTNVVRGQKLLFLTVLSMFMALQAVSQGPSYVFVRNAPSASQTQPVVQVKWFSNDILNPEGFNLYRREVGVSNWVKLNTTPITRGVMPAGVRAQDEEIDFLVDVVTKSPEDLKEDFLYLNLLLKTFESNQLANFLGIFYNDTQINFGSTYQYRVGVIKGANEIYLTNSKPIQADIYQEGNAVSGIEVYQDRKSISVNWEQDEQSFYGVNVYSVKSGDTTQLNNEPVILTMAPDSTGVYGYPDPMFMTTGFEELETYSFLVEGVDYFGEETRLSKAVTLIFDDTTPPPVPGNLKGKADSLRVRLTWDQELAPDFKGFNIYRSVKSTGPYVKVNASVLDADIREYNEKLEIPGPYYYAVEALDHSNNPIRSAPAFVDAQDVFPPAQPKRLTIVSDTGRFVLKWEMNTEPDLLGYYIYRTVDADLKGNYVLMNGDPVDTNVFVQVLPKVVKNDFYYYIVAVDTSFNRSLDSDFATAVLPDVTPPEEPFVERIDYTEEGIIINWTKNVESDLVGYHVYRSDSVKGPFSKINIELLAAFSFRYTDRSAEPNKQYHYAIRAVDRAGNISKIEKPAAAKWYREHEVKEDLVLTLKTKKRNRTNRLEWNFIDDNSIKGYIIFRGPSERVVKPLTGVINDKFTFVDKVEKNKDYYYQVRAYTTSGQVIYSEILETSL